MKKIKGKKLKKAHRHYNEYYNITIIILTLRNLNILRAQKI